MPFIVFIKHLLRNLYVKERKEEIKGRRNINLLAWRGNLFGLSEFRNFLTHIFARQSLEQSFTAVNRTKFSWMKRFRIFKANKLTFYDSPTPERLLLQKKFSSLKNFVWWWKMIWADRGKCEIIIIMLRPVKREVLIFDEIFFRTRKFSSRIPPRSVISLSGVCRVIDSWWDWVWIVSLAVYFDVAEQKMSNLGTINKI